MQNKKIFLIIIFFLPIFILSQDEKKLSKKEANEEVKRLTILTEELQSEKEELNNKLMIEYEKLLSQMDENSNLRTENGELKSEIRDMQQELLELQKLLTQTENEKLSLIEENNTHKNNIRLDSISLKNLNDSIIFIKNLSDSILNEKTNLESNIYNKEMELYKKIKEEVLGENSVELLLYLEGGGVGFEGDEWTFNFYYLNEKNNTKTYFRMFALPVWEVKLTGSLQESGFYGWETEEMENEWVRKDLYKVTFKLDYYGYETTDVWCKLIELELAEDLSKEEIEYMSEPYFIINHLND